MKARTEMEIVNNIANENVDFWRIPKGSTTKSGKKMFNVRLAFSPITKNSRRSRLSIYFGPEALGIMGPFTRAKVSSLEVVANRIYFGFYTDNHIDGTYTISRLKKGNHTDIRIQYSLTEKESKVFMNKWREGYYKLEFDSNYNLYYIETFKEN